MSLKEWAEKEIEIACKREKPDRKEGEWDYGCACYESALKAFKSLLEDEHSGLSISITKNILNRLIDVKPLTPIEDTDDIWTLEHVDKYYTSTYQCKRMRALFKYVYSDGNVKYHDIDRVIGVNINEPTYAYHNNFINNIIDEMYPITMPYMPYGKPFKVYTEEFLVDKKHGDFDTIAILYLTKPDGERVEINRYFREPESDIEENCEYHGWVEISKEEYEERKSRRIDKEDKSND